MSTPDNRPPRRADRIFHDRVEEIRLWRAQHERFPAGRSTDPLERILGRWLSNVRTTHRGNTGKGPSLNDARIRLLDEALPGWDKTVPGNIADDALFTARVQQVAAFVAKNKRMPLTSSDEADGLGRWLTRVRAAATGKGNMAWTPERAAIIQKHLPGWLDGDKL